MHGADGGYTLPPRGTSLPEELRPLGEVVYGSWAESGRNRRSSSEQIWWSEACDDEPGREIMEGSGEAFRGTSAGATGYGAVRRDFYEKDVLRPRQARFRCVGSNCFAARPRRTLLSALALLGASYLLFSLFLDTFMQLSRNIAEFRTLATRDKAGNPVKVTVPFAPGARAVNSGNRQRNATQSDEEGTRREYVDPEFGILNIGASVQELPLMASSFGALEFPRIIHQTWKNRDSLPAKFKEWSESWKIHHPRWTYMLWTDEENRGLIATSYPWFLHTYDSFKHHIQKVDAARYFYLHKYGGIYADLDVECLRPLDPIASKLIDRAAVFSMGNKWELETGDPRHDHDLPNAVMASGTPGHPFWLLCAAMVMDAGRKAAEDPSLLVPKGRVDVTESVAGPVLLRRCVKEWRKLSVGGAGGILAVVPAPLFFPYDWAFPSKGENEWKLCWVNSDAFDHGKCLELQRTKGIDGGKGPFTITYWSKTWAQGTRRVE